MGPWLLQAIFWHRALQVSVMRVYAVGCWGQAHT